VKQFATIFLVCAFFAALFAVRIQAQPNSGPAAPPAANDASAPAPGHTEPAQEMIPSAAPALFTIPVLELPVTNSMICTWIVAVLILLIVRATTWKLTEVPHGGQNLMETIIEVWQNLMSDILDKKVTGWVFPFATTFFIFIILSNFVDLIPGVGSIGSYHDGTFTPYFRPPTTDANLTVAMAGIFLVLNLIWAVRYNGFWGVIKHIFGVKMETGKWVYPLFLLLFLFVGVMDLLSILVVRPVALAMRLYGNIFGGENMIHMMLHNKSFWLSVISALPFYFYEVFVCTLQAFVFALLTIAFVATICTPADEH
jgi:F-type H+-transporting ATPase subunit a